MRHGRVVVALAEVIGGSHIDGAATVGMTVAGQANNPITYSSS